MHTTLLPLSSPSIPFLTAASCCHRSMLGERFSLQQGAAPLRAAPIQIELPLAKSICCKLCHPNRLTKSICCHLNRPAPFDSVRSWTNQPAGGQIDLSPPILHACRLILRGTTQIEAVLLDPPPLAAFASAACGSWSLGSSPPASLAIGVGLRALPTDALCPSSAGGRAPPGPSSGGGCAPPGASSSRGPVPPELAGGQRITGRRKCVEK